MLQVPGVVHASGDKQNLKHFIDLVVLVNVETTIFYQIL